MFAQYQLLHQIRKKTTINNLSTLSGGFDADHLREWAMLTNFGSNDIDSITGQEIRKRKRQIPEDENKLPYVDLFSTKISSECSKYISNQHSPTDVLGRAFFGCNSFRAEKMLLNTMNTLFSLYPTNATTLPSVFNMRDQYLSWKVTSLAPSEIILSYNIESLRFRGATMLAYDPSLRKVYHGNCIDVTNERMKGFIPELAIQMHVKYAESLLHGMVEELENLAIAEEVKQKV